MPVAHDPPKCKRFGDKIMGRFGKRARKVGGARMKQAYPSEGAPGAWQIKDHDPTALILRRSCNDRLEGEGVSRVHWSLLRDAASRLLLRMRSR
jgi:hypothetical protein